MSGDLLNLEPEIELEPETDDLEIELEAEPTAQETPAAPVQAAPVEVLPLMQVLPADFPLPALTKFVPNPALRVTAEEAVTYALSVDVTGPEGLQRADLALSNLRSAHRLIEEHFEEPKDIANRLHKSITGTLADWLAPGKAAIDLLGRKVFQEKRRLEAIAAEERRKAQEEADRRAREQARREAEAAAKAKAPETVVKELQRQAETATAPPVATPAAAPAAMRGTSVVTTWKARFVGSSGEAVSAPCVDEMSAAQREQFMVLLRAIVDGQAPVSAVEPNWSYLQRRAKADKSTLQIPGIEAYEDGSVRAKGSRAK